MPDIRCPNCRDLVVVPSAAFGSPFECPRCGDVFQLDTVHLARYRLPAVLVVQLADQQGAPFEGERVTVLIEYGYRLPPLRTDLHGRVKATRDMFLRAQKDEIETGLMDHKGDYALNRYIRVSVPTAAEASAAANARRMSRWPILPLEADLYVDIDSLLKAYVPFDDVGPAAILIDLAADIDTAFATLRLP